MYEEELAVAKKAVYAAMENIMRIYQEEFEVEIKDDDSPVTLADKSSDELIRGIILKSFPDHAFLTEESEDDPIRKEAEYIWIIDPLDGTKNFVARDGEFAVNVALVRRHTPVVGVVGVPVKGEVYYAVKGEGAYFASSSEATPIRIHVSDKTDDLTLLSSIFHVNDDEIAIAKRYEHKIARTRKIGSAIKACKIANGEAEISFRFNPNTKEWDTCAPQLVVEEAGGFFTKPSGEPITYNREDVYNREGFSIYNLKINNFAKDFNR